MTVKVSLTPTRTLTSSPATWVGSVRVCAGSATHMQVVAVIFRVRIGVRVWVRVWVRVITNSSIRYLPTRF